jgi:hypothetical protein
MNLAIWHKLGCKPYIKIDIRTHTNGYTGYYRIQVVTTREIAERFLREHKRCVSVGQFYCKNRRAMAERLRKRISGQATHAQHDGAYRRTRRSGDLIQDLAVTREG